MNDAQDQMFAAQTYPSVGDYKRIFDKVLMANNGVVYVMNKVIAPATYSSVMAPALYNKNAQVINTVIHADDAYTTTNFQSAPLQKYYSTYLLAMQSNFSFFVPTDDGLKNFGYVDPVKCCQAKHQLPLLDDGTAGSNQEGSLCRCTRSRLPLSFGLSVES